MKQYRITLNDQGPSRQQLVIDMGESKSVLLFHRGVLEGRAAQSKLLSLNEDQAAGVAEVPYYRVAEAEVQDAKSGKPGRLSMNARQAAKAKKLKENDDG